MKRQPPVSATGKCSHCPARMVGAGASVRAAGFSAIPSRLAAQATDGVWNAVVTTLGRGTLLIRRREDGPACACPLRAYEIRTIAAKLPPVREQGAEGAGQGIFRPVRAGSCKADG